MEKAIKKENESIKYLKLTYHTITYISERRIMLRKQIHDVMKSCN